MKHKLGPFHLPTLVLAFVLSSDALSAAENAVRYTAQPNTSKMRISGTSTIHDWTVEGTLIGGYFEAGPEFFNDPSTVAKLKPNVSAIVPVRSIKSDKPGMDSVMHEAMKEKDNPRISFTLKEMTLKTKGAAVDGPHLFDTVGELTVAGVKKSTSMVVAMEKLSENRLKFTGTNSLKMTDFGITPPAPAIGLGLIKTGDDVKVSFEWITKAGSP